ncbi:Senescence-specific cysteine protease SAG39 [Seminavis robusta]|uniref:Senescence-specific cysteine protease SAG39 n=1 Tax=Seminavis robusta TaxID=568900 RepID=A0A9N8EE87_9STRA|nr:Senescence-specific cysteine protease SAG39 [Seminavis robusta]|eukprot:Sro1051_g235710.1 Senescence-specific cysteine protease SAG39 (490) ;mRNA; f:23091-24755
MMPRRRHSPMFAIRSFTIRVLLIAFCLAPSSLAQFNSSCSEDAVANCASENRICYIAVVSQEETCGPCVEGYVDFPPGAVVTLEASTNTDLTRLYNCFAIDKLTVALFIERFAPTFLNGQVGNETQRLIALVEAARTVAEFNRKSGDTNTSREAVELALNEFAMDTPEERETLLGYLRPEEGEDTGSNNVFVPSVDTPYPSSVNWRELGAVTSVKNQGRCGCCWAISTVGALEGAAAIASNFTYLQSLSFQQFISCDLAHKGCNGGFPSQAFDYADDRGVAKWEDYPYTDGKSGTTTETCELKGKPIEVETGPGYKVNYYGDVDDDTFTKRVDRMKSALAKGPVAISINANCARIMLYRKGILTDDGACACTPDMETCHNHAILMVGYSDNALIPYWIIKNSWGFLWGEGGYFRVAQLNPLDTENSYGLFGVLAEGIIPEGTAKSTGKVFDKNERRPTWWKVLVACLVILGVCVIALVALFAWERFGKK